MKVKPHKYKESKLWLSFLLFNWKVIYPWKWWDVPDDSMLYLGLWGTWSTYNRNGGMMILLFSETCCLYFLVSLLFSSNGKVDGALVVSCWNAQIWRKGSGRFWEDNFSRPWPGRDTASFRGLSSTFATCGRLPWKPWWSEGEPGFTSLGGGFKYFLCSPLPGEMIPIWRTYFWKGLVQPPN